MAIYPLDITGELASNRILNEQAIISAGSPDLHKQLPFVIPQFAPFFDNAQFVLRRNGSPLTKDVDYQFVAQSWHARDYLGKNVYGGIVFLDRQAAGNVSIDYNTIGSDFVTNDPQLLAAYYQTLLQQRVVNWDLVYGVPFELPPLQAQQNLADLKGTDDVVEAINDVVEAIEQNDTGPLVAAINALGAALTAHVDNSNAHGTTAADLNLGNLGNWSHLGTTIANLLNNSASGGDARRYLTTGNAAHWDVIKQGILFASPGLAGQTVDPNTTSQPIFRSSSLADIDLNGVTPSGDLYVIQLRANSTFGATALNASPRIQIGMLVSGSASMAHLMLRYINPGQPVPVWTVAPNWARLKTMLDNITAGLQVQVDAAVSNRIRYGTHAPTSSDFQKVGDVYYRHEP